MTREQYNLYRDIGILVVSIAFAITLGLTDAIPRALGYLHFSKTIAAFFAGMFFTSVFTTAPAMVALGEIAQTNSVVTTAFAGAIGAVIGDYLIYRFIRDSVSEDLHYLFSKIRHEKLSLFLHGRFHELRVYRWLVPLMGALIIASPLPDELGLAILGLSKVKSKTMVPLTFAFNFLGILIIGLVTQKFI